MRAVGLDHGRLFVLTDHGEMSTFLFALPMELRNGRVKPPQKSGQCPETRPQGRLYTLYVL